jgi:dsRNA-specific ribonuclease
MTEQSKSKYPSWSDQYSTLVLIQLAKGTDWKSKFSLVDGREGDEFKVTLENGGEVFEGIGSSKKKAEHRAAFKLLKTIRNLKEVAKENSLQFLGIISKVV